MLEFAIKYKNAVELFGLGLSNETFKYTKGDN